MTSYVVHRCIDQHVHIAHLLLYSPFPILDESIDIGDTGSKYKTLESQGSVIHLSCHVVLPPVPTY